MNEVRAIFVSRLHSTKFTNTFPYDESKKCWLVGDSVFKRRSLMKDGHTKYCIFDDSSVHCLIGCYHWNEDTVNELKKNGINYHTATIRSTGSDHEFMYYQSDDKCNLDLNHKRTCDFFKRLVVCEECEHCKKLIRGLSKLLDIDDVKQALKCCSRDIVTNVDRYNVSATCYLTVDGCINPELLSENYFMEWYDYWYKDNCTIFKLYGEDFTTAGIVIREFTPDPIKFCEENSITYRIINDFEKQYSKRGVS